MGNAVGKALPACVSKGLSEVGHEPCGYLGGRVFRLKDLPVQRPWGRSVLVPGIGRRPRQRGNRAGSCRSVWATVRTWSFHLRGGKQLWYIRGPDGGERGEAGAGAVRVTARREGRTGVQGGDGRRPRVMAAGVLRSDCGDSADILTADTFAGTGLWAVKGQGHMTGGGRPRRK